MFLQTFAPVFISEPIFAQYFCIFYINVVIIMKRRGKMAKVKDKEDIKYALEHILLYFDVDEFVGVDIYDMERALKNRDNELEELVDKILKKFKKEITEPGVYEFILSFAEDNTPLLYEKLKNLK